jgi:hypothetical protein
LTSGLIETPATCNYCNSGFECPTVPDNPPRIFTFVVVDVETAAAEIMMVNPGNYAISVAPVPATPSVVLFPAMDYSSHVRILNEGSEPLTLTQTNAAQATGWSPPPQTIPAGGRGGGMQSMRCCRDEDPGLARADHVGSCQVRAHVSSGTPALIDVPPTALESFLGSYFRSSGDAGLGDEWHQSVTRQRGGGLKWYHILYRSGEECPWRSPQVRLGRTCSVSSSR